MDNTNDNNNNNEKQPDPCCCRRKGAKLQCYDWLADLPEAQDDTEMVEVPVSYTHLTLPTT